MGTYLGAVDLVTQNQLTIVARYGVNPADRMLGDVNSGEVIISVNNTSTTDRQVGHLIAAEFNVTKSLSLVDNMGGGQRFSTGQVSNFYSNPSSGYVTFNQQVGTNFGTISLTSTNFSSQLFDTPGTHSWTVPAGVTSISVAGIGGGGGGAQKSAGGSGGGGGLITYSNSIAVTPGTTCTIFVGGGGATGGTYGVTGSSTYLLLPGTNVPIVIAQGGAGGDSIFWLSNSIGVSYTDATKTITIQTAYDPAGGTISYSVSAGSLPTGASLNTGTGVISWVRQSLSLDTEYAPFTLSATNSTQTITKPFTLKILYPTPTVEYLVVAGGGAGGYSYGGGGGAGGYRIGTGLAVTSDPYGTYAVTVGAGGPASSSSIQGKGQDSVFSTITSTGGGGGAYDGVNGFTGGSGGGGSYNLKTGGAGNTPSTSPSQGNTGGNSGPAGGNFGGGGGGAGAVGYSGTATYLTANGGIGLASSISGVSTYYAGGGGGWTRNTGSTLGGTGGGGTGAGGVSAGGAATINTGGGGGASGGANPSGAGGSGIVIIRYADTYPAANATTGSPTITVAGGYRVYKWTSSGSITF